jgi:hypothetical protein
MSNMEDCPHGMALIRVWGAVAAVLIGGVSWYGIVENVDLGPAGTTAMYTAAWMSPLILIALFRRG